MKRLNRNDTLVSYRPHKRDDRCYQLIRHDNKKLRRCWDSAKCEPLHGREFDGIRTRFRALRIVRDYRIITIRVGFVGSQDTDDLSCHVPIFTARRLAKRGICRRRVSVRLSVCVCVSVTLRYCIKTAKRRITQITSHDSPLTLVFWHQSSLRNSNGITPYGARNAGGVG